MCRRKGVKKLYLHSTSHQKVLPLSEFPDLSEADGVHPSHAHANQLTLELVSKYKVASPVLDDEAKQH